MMQRSFRACLVLLAAGCGAVAQDGPMELWTQAAIYRDAWGVPFVRAENTRAMAFGFGYAQAQDHLDTMLRAYRMAAGRLAAVEGESAVPSDELALRMAHLELAKDAYANADPLTRDLVEGFAVGVNAYIADFPDGVPDWAEGVHPTEILALMHCYLMSYAPLDLPEAWKRPVPAATGNACALGPERTTSGNAMLFINPHEDYEGLFRWTEARLEAPGYRIAGAALYGLPIILQGYNARLGWALTPNNPDTADIYAEPAPTISVNPKSLMGPSQEQRLLVDLATLLEPTIYYVHTPSGLERRQVGTRMAPRGPVLGALRRGLRTWKAGGYRDFGAIRQLYEMGAAGSLDAFLAALDRHQLPCFHAVYADAEGNIAYRYLAKAGERIGPAAGISGSPEGDRVEVRTDWTKPLPADHPGYEWGPILPPSALPQTVNPPSGFLQACNTNPWDITQPALEYPGAFPLWMANEPHSFRARRVNDLLAMGTRSFTDLQLMAFDVLAPAAVEAVARLRAIAEARPEWLRPLHPDTGAALELLGAWNRTADVNTAGMTVYHVWRHAFQQLVPEETDATRLIEAFASEGSHSQQGIEALSRTARLLRNEFGTLEQPWGEVHVVKRGNRIRPLAGAISGQPILVAGDRTFSAGRWFAAYGYGYAALVEFGRTPQAVSVSPFGASEDPDSPHFDDQFGLMTERRFKPARFPGVSAIRHAEKAEGRVIVLIPRGVDARMVLRSEAVMTARIETTPKPPAQPPQGRDPYTLYLLPQAESGAFPVEASIELQIPAEHWPEKNASQLALYRIGPGHGWVKATEQQVNPQQRVLRAHDRLAAAYAVFGPPRGEAPPPFAVDADQAGEVPGQSEHDAKTAAMDDEVPPIEGSTAEGPGRPPATPGKKIEIALPSAGGAIAWGRSIELPTPEAGGLIEVVANQQIGARLLVLEEVPAPLPEGTELASALVRVEASDPTAVTQVRVVRAAPHGAADPEGRFAVYAYDEDAGWTQLGGASFDPEKRSWTAKDASPRTYALLQTPGKTPEV